MVVFELQFFFPIFNGWVTLKIKIYIRTSTALTSFNTYYVNNLTSNISEPVEIEEINGFMND